MKKFLLPIFLILSSNAIAAEAPKVKLGGSIDTQIGYRKQKAPYDAIQNSASTAASSRGQKLNSGAIVNDTRLNVNVDGNHNGLKYGAVIKLFADTSASSSGNPNNGDKVWAYVETKYGRLEGANTKSAAHTMMISGKDVAKATGGYDGTTYYWYNDYVINDLNDLSKNARVGRYFLTSAGLPTFGKNKSAANKLVYYTPKFNGWQLGVSYIIDPSLRGTLSELHTDTRTSGIGFKDVVDASVRYDNKINDVTYGVSLGGEHGKAKNGSDNPNREDLKAWVAGAKAGYKGITIAGSYANWMNTGRPKDKLPGAKFGSQHWTAGVAYDYEKLGVSITYMESKEANSFIYKAVAKADQDKSFNKYKIVSFGADYKVAAGMLTYAEVSKFKFHRDKSAINNRGAVILAGTKLNF
jgi:predicted porin